MTYAEALLKDVRIEFNLDGMIIRVLSLVHIHPDPEWRVDYHSHTDYELHFIPRGRGYICLEGKNFEVNAGQFYVTGPYVRHSQRADTEYPMEEYCMECTLKANGSHQAEALSEALSAVMQRCHTSPEALEIMEKLMHEDRKPGCLLRMQGLTIQLLALIQGSIGTGYADALQQGQQDLQAERLRGFLLANFREHLTLHDASKALFLCERQINRLMKRFNSQPFHKYLVSLRLQEARRLLANGESVDNAAVKSGFSSKYYMYQAFKNAGLPTPGSLRRCGE